ncbi:MAG TPA: cellulase family glycosylhydrolase [Pyrinomonadaceae bacterium]|nr:cellulase family glycosylhydrolase [Pyrinomonadaceae bacterium]
MKLRSSLAVVSLVLSLFTSADHRSINCKGCWQPSTEPIAISEAFGVNVHFIDPDPAEIKMIADAGFRWVRTDFKWELTEVERGKYDFTRYEPLVSELGKQNLRALFILDYGNPLYTQGMSVRTPDAREAFARWAVAAAKHFSGRGIIWEVFNEPNHPIFWPPKPNVHEYTALAAAVAKAFQSEAPNEKLIGPATAGIEVTFLESCFEAGLLNHWSAVSIHPYRETNPETVAGDYALLRETIDRYRIPTARDSGRVIDSARTPNVISGEWGYSSAWQGMSEEKQAALLARQFLTNVANGIPLSIWYDWQDDGSNPAEAEHHFGLMRYRSGRSIGAFEAKPAYLAAKTLIANLRGFVFQERLTVGSDDDYVLVFSKGREPRYVGWTTSSTPHRVMIPQITGLFNVTRLTGESGGTRAPNSGTLSIDVTTSPLYLNPTR